MNMFKEPLRFLRFQKVKLTPEVLWKGFRAQIRDATTWPDKAADVLTAWFGTVGFLAGNALLFAGWLLWNTGYLGFAPFDPFPFIFLTMIVSLEAIFLSVIVLITQNRQSKIADLRQKMDFEIDVRAEDEITKILQLLAELHRHAGLADRDEELEHMIQKTDLRKIEEEIRNRPG
ncbi:hypothetical protein A3C21_00605 [Candidatus Kaiserbacteria bacterium RIFCSPHIGHO2_02_FULL_59_21]|uniref:DUF1003 domain-containing protein n=1 Tax=Candidatus Kaiserbacteria bacterium RIFCSPHIGHO2_02_FULL_59_21 TaxID=1798500 RepID=A0A1F6DZP6_9BACT|nr:MAG: hypothetical protein A2766_01815 [Candidatus Kaiserbacteria bacterium RIFCSPHIGHO2_01_FULL_58_22]OGG66901.1 MAG: hypothetical protein A3C21_00605 [Candidatus Kaiserbacteria bacterium RIFCSPHIGHO2_02_FULL_59_21]OGG80580.1 MAG: hypothetical protein A2952_00110 [Candidatus Kaiserbacteria bacterium RIFCSPLOWO2_01_FULL_59_34]OGG85477.1 MAG: hypothetical protein A3I47_00830 [Candidatus Kaiserbacteria bacterium RIFCSPLOWO2_02_FULL_59_19]